MRELTVYKGKEKAHIRGGVLAGAKFLAAVIILCAACALTYAVAQFFSGDKTVSVSHEVSGDMPVVVIDAGHGGMDGGASEAGVLEKDINLAVAMRIEELFRISGIECVMTRTDDRMLVDDSITSHRKMHDLKNRLAVAGELTDNGKSVIFVSIHMNKFSVSKYSGLQVWYSPNNEESSKLASYIQSYAKSFLDRENNREIKRATSAIYILERAKIPAVLVECGFLSNPEECAKLAQSEYQTKLAATVFASVVAWMSGQGKA